MSADRLSPIWANPDRMPVFSLLEWEVVLGQAMQARLVARLAQHLADHGWLSQVPAQPRQYLEGGLRLVGRQHDEVKWQVACIQRALNEIETPVILLKGAAYVIAGLPPARGRLFSDLTIFLKEKEGYDSEGVHNHPNMNTASEANPSMDVLASKACYISGKSGIWSLEIHSRFPA